MTAAPEPPFAGADTVPVPPTVRVRVVDRHSGASLDDVAAGVLVPADDAAPIAFPLEGQRRAKDDATRRALQTLPARKFHVKATAPGYAQLNYLDGPISLFYEHVVVDAAGLPRREVIVEMERRVACVWLSCADAATGAALPLAKITLRRRGSDVDFAFQGAGPHDAHVGPEFRDAVYDVSLALPGYVLWSPKTITLSHGRTTELHARCRETAVAVSVQETPRKPGVFGLWRPLSRSHSSQFGSFLNR